MKYGYAILAAGVVFSLMSGDAARSETLESQGYKRAPLTDRHLASMKKHKIPAHKFVRVKKGDDSSWMYVDPVDCRCYYYGRPGAGAPLKDRSWGDKVADWAQHHGDAMDDAMMNDPGEGPPLWSIF
ncbi:MAG: hypothetical protein ACK5JM_13125 [Rhodoblastus sp.]